MAVVDDKSCDQPKQASSQVNSEEISAGKLSNDISLEINLNNNSAKKQTSTSAMSHEAKQNVNKTIENAVDEMPNTKHSLQTSKANDTINIMKDLSVTTTPMTFCS